MCTSGVRSALDDLFGTVRQNEVEDGNPVEVIYVDQYFAEGSSVEVDGVTYTVTDGNLVLDVQVDPVNVHTTLEFWGISIPLGNISVSGSGSDPGGPGGPGGDTPTMPETVQ